MEKLQKILKSSMLLMSLTILITIQFYLIKNNGVNIDINLSGSIDSINSISGNLDLKNNHSGRILNINRNSYEGGFFSDETHDIYDAAINWERFQD